MADKEFIVTHGKARAPITVKGKTLLEALEKEGLNPSIWKPITPPEPEESSPDIETGS